MTSNPRLLSRAAVLALLVLALADCGGGSPKYLGAVPTDTIPYEHPEYWPLSKGSTRYPFLVHYRTNDEEPMVDEIIIRMETAWRVEIEIQGNTPPPSDQGFCGPDGRFDIFAWRGINTCQVDVVAGAPRTAWGGQASYMKIDPWGDYGGDLLGATVAHEFNHATHAANDWAEIPIAFEMCASYVEQFFGPVASYSVLGFQARPDWGLLRGDNYATWYMYGSALYIHFLRDCYLHGNDGWLPELWVAMRNQGPDFSVNAPHFVNAVDGLLWPVGASFLDTLPAFARWRYYAGLRDDGQHFRRLPTQWTQHAFLPEATLAIPQVTLGNLSRPLDPAPMLTGCSYLEVKRASEAQTSFQVALQAPASPGLRWVVQAVPGLVDGRDGDLVDLSAGSARVVFAPGGKRTLILIPVPTTAYDPNHPSDTRYPASLVLVP